MKKISIKIVSLTLLFSFSFQLLFPVACLALTTGPSQPEFLDFEPVGTTELVDLFSGDFVYNIPLMEIDGYPINISYHSGIGVEQEASWVGLGWSLNPGEINRGLRGLPDDLNGEKINKRLNIQPETNFMGEVGMQAGAELFGKDLKEYLDKKHIDASASLTLYLNSNNYKGLSAGARLGTSFSYLWPHTDNKATSGEDASDKGVINSINASPNIGVGSQSGAEVSASVQYQHSKLSEKNADVRYKYGVGVGSGINSRTGMKAVSLDVYALRSKEDGTEPRNKGNGSGFQLSTYIPIGLQNYVPLATSATTLKSFHIQLKYGIEAFGAYGNVFAGINVSRFSYSVDGGGDNDDDRKAYGYMYLENADRASVLDFIRDKDGVYNKTMQNLPPSSLAYDVYSVTGHGTGGAFRPFRNDIGTVYDPAVVSYQDNTSGAIEFGKGNLVELGIDITDHTNKIYREHWVRTQFKKNIEGSVGEKLYFKQAGELTYNHQLGFNSSSNNALLTGPAPIIPTVLTTNFFSEDNGTVQLTSANATQSINFDDNLGYQDIGDARTVRANLLRVLPNSLAGIQEVSGKGKNQDFNAVATDFNNFSEVNRPVDENNANKVGYISQTLPDGRRYIYGLPAMNYVTRELTFGSIADNASDKIKKGGGLVTTSVIPNADDGSGSENAFIGSLPSPEQYYNSTVMPGYAHAWLLTDVLSPDYVDIMGDGCTDDDLGGFVKFNYTRKSAAYHWRVPANNLISPGAGIPTAHFDPGFQSDPRDGKASVTMGVRDQWYVKSIESKDLVAEFYISARQDGKGYPETINNAFQANSDDQNMSYKLDSIRLFNKSQRYLSSNPSPIKTIIFAYDYSLCPNTPNSTAANKGKLTLKKLYIRYGHSDRNLLNPYEFNYNNVSNNDPYDYEAKDRWGNRKTVNQTLSNFEFPYTPQQDYSAPNTDPVTAYNLVQIIMPSGGKLNIEYEADDYAFVQDKKAMEMFAVKGFGNSETYSPEGSHLYVDKDEQYQYVYFQRGNDGLHPTNVTADELRRKYLKDEKYLYFSLSVAVREGAHEQVKGFAEVESIGLCTANNSSGNYAYIKLKKVNVRGIDFNPMALYAINYCKHYIPHVFYPGFNTADLKQVISSFVQAASEIGNLLNPYKTFVKRGYCRNTNLNKSWIRLQTPDHKKKGGGVRVKKIILFDEWAETTQNLAQETRSYGKEFDYTIEDKDYGVISSGVASYEPMEGGDENAMRQPLPYTAAQDLVQPAVEFYQLEPIGEQFFPGANVGYSSVKVRSIHIDKGKSSMSEDENLFYTARDFPIWSDNTDARKLSDKHWSVGSVKVADLATQGFSLHFNDMHGKPKAINSYLVKRFENGVATDRELIKGMVYHYKRDAAGKLNNLVKALVRDGNEYKIKSVELGKEIDVTFDSRKEFDESKTFGGNLNANVTIYPPVTVAVPSAFASYSYESALFRSFVATKIIQEYGILEKVEIRDRNAVTVVENMVFDAQTGSVLLSKTNNEYNDNEYMQALPAYLAYDNMGAAYENIDYKETDKSVFINSLRDGYLEPANPNMFTTGDELYVKQNGGTIADKLWVVEKKVIDLSEYYGFKNSPHGYVAVFREPAFPIGFDTPTPIDIKINIKQTSGSTLYSNVSVNVPFPGENELWNLPLNPNVNLFEIPNPVPSSTSQYEIDGPQIVIPTGNNNGNTAGITLHSPAASLNVAPGKLLIITFRPSSGETTTAVTNLYVVNGEYEQSKCLLRVAPRYNLRHGPQSTSSDHWWWTNPTARLVDNLSVQVVRSGRRNLLNRNILETASMSVPSSATNENATLSQFLTKTKIVSTKATTYTEQANEYEGNVQRLLLTDPGSSTGKVYEGMNDYVLGLKGNFKPESEQVPFVNRDYTTSHSRFAGVYNLANLYWEPYTPTVTCGEPRKYVYEYPVSYPNQSTWKRASLVTKYDMFGNSVEEKDALEIYSTAQYGSNKKMPVAVAYNSKQQGMFFDGFEDYTTIIVPEVYKKLFLNYGTSATIVSGGAAPTAGGYLHSPFASVFTAAGNYFAQAGRGYYTLAAPANPSVTTDAHTGTSALSIGASWSLNLTVKDIYSSKLIERFSFIKGQSYIVNFWAKPTSAGAVTANITGLSATQNFVAKTKAIDGWQLYEARIDIPQNFSQTTLALNLGGNIKVDDIRIFPAKSNMKCFIYDYRYNNRVMAELDNNHFATYYEYDLEGQLTRIKKETVKGIVTIKENRKALKSHF